MATRNIVPRATGEGSIGTPEKKWNSANIKNINAESIDIDNLDATNLDVDNLDVHSESVSPVNTLQRGTTYAADDIVYTSKLNAKYYLLCITGGTTGSVEPSFVGAGSNTEVTDGTVVWRVQTVTSQEKAAGVPVGFEYFQMNPNVPEGSLPLLGGVYSRDTYADLWAWVQTQSGYLKTEAEWQALSTSNNGNVPFYSDGDGSTTFRVPSLHCWVKGSDGSAQLVGSYLQAGLPNITGELINQSSATSAPSWGKTGAFTDGIDGTFYWVAPTMSNNDTRFGITFDASLSSSIYGNANTVQPESIVGMWLVKAYGTIVDTGSIDERAYMDEQLALNVPVGCVQAYAGQTTPQGWLLCDGSAISRTQYSRLFGVIGTSYGAGDGTDTFNLPNLVDKFIQGNSVAGTEHTAGLPNITGGIATVSGGVFLIGSQSEAIYPADAWAAHIDAPIAGSEASNGFSFDASRSNAIYGNSNTVQPPSVTMRYIIKY